MLKTSVSLEGPFFQRDPALTVRQNIRDMLVAVAAEGQAAVQANFPVGGGNDPHSGLGRSGVVGRVASITGKRWALHAVISEQHIYPWPRTGRGGESLRSGRRMVANSAGAQYRGGKLERRLHMFGSVNAALQSSRAAISADLSKGLE